MTQQIGQNSKRNGAKKLHRSYGVRLVTLSSAMVAMSLLIATSTTSSAPFRQLLSGTHAAVAAAAPDGASILQLQTTTEVTKPGPDGVSGVAGPVGPQGQAGPIGLTGLQGPIGLTGLTGAIGPQGQAGPIGLTGSQGPIGSIGPGGPTGAEGPAGAQGQMGPQGPAGPSILNGQWYGSIDPAGSYIGLAGGFASKTENAASGCKAHCTQWTAPFFGHVTQLQFSSSVESKVWTVVVRDDGAATVLTCSTATNGGQCSDQTSSVSIQSGDRLNVSIVSSAGAKDPGNFSWSVEFTA